MTDNTENIYRGMHCLLQRWRDTVSTKGRRLGWKVGFNLAVDQQRLHLPSALIGYLTRDQLLTSGQSYSPPSNSKILVEPEVAIQMACDVPENVTALQARAVIARYTAALELVDTTRSANDNIEAILAGNLFHDSVLLADTGISPADYSRDALTVSLSLNGREMRTLEQERVPQDFSPLVVTIANILATHGEQLRQGDWIITGAASKAIPVQQGDVVTLDMGTLGRLSLTIA